MENKCENCTKSKHRTEKEKKDFSRRLKIISGQLNSIAQKIEDDCYCNDILLQVASATNGLKSLGNELLRSHMKSCMVEEINEGNLEIIDEVIQLFGKIK